MIRFPLFSENWKYFKNVLSDFKFYLSKLTNQTFLPMWCNIDFGTGFSVCFFLLLLLFFVLLIAVKTDY